ncbi:hypothetical protein Droror1_Dr00024301 [Drosera rotundifolia]
MEFKLSLLLLFFLHISFICISNVVALTNQGTALDCLFREKYLSRNPAVTSHISRGVADIVEGRVDYNAMIRSHGSKDSDRIDRLPRQPHVDFAQYSGYVTIDEATGKTFFYYHVEAEKTPETKPLVLWLNGGPGCSSLAFGAMEELGPFRVHSNGMTLFQNLNAWNQYANIVFLESPAHVGFSYTNTTSDLTTGDDQTAKDNMVFLLNWLERFPEYKGRNFYIAGESYAGHYVPQLAHQIIQHNKGGKNSINFKGILMGNAVINDETDSPGMYEYWWTHALISDQAHDMIMQQCDFSPNATFQTEACLSAAYLAEKTFEDINIYNIYASFCENDSLSTNYHNRSLKVFDECSDNYVENYMNMPEVQKALHANVTNLPYDWEECVSEKILHYQQSAETTIPYIKEALASGLRVWMFSGDVDGRVPVTSTKESIKKIGLTLKDQLHPWYVGGEVAGYVETYNEGFIFFTVRGAGHMVPSYQGKRALAMFGHFLAGTPLPGPRRQLS